MLLRLGTHVHRSNFEYLKYSVLLPPDQMAKKTKQHRRLNPPQNTPWFEDETKRRKFFQKYAYYLEGMLDYFQMNHSYDDAQKDPRVLGWTIGRQIIALYLVEMLLRIDFERRGITRNISTHNLGHLFRKLPKDRQDRVEQIYIKILNNECEWTWDVCRTVESFLNFLGKQPIVATRYFWQQGDKGTLFAPRLFRPLVSALLIALYGYPYEEGSLDKRFDTEFRSFSESRKNRFDSKGNRIVE